MSARAINRFILPRARLGCRSTFAHTQHPATVLSVGGFTNETPANAPELPPFRVRLVQVLCRHGDRAPVINCMEGSSKQASEAQLWAERQADPSVLSQLRRTFPVEVQSNSPLPAPADIPPFGGITTKGLQQMTDVGKQLRRLVVDKYGMDLASHHVAARASNIVRTQVSAQALLDGLLPEPTRAPGDKLPRVYVSSASSENINAYDFKAPYRHLIAEMSQSPEFLAREEKLVHIREALVAAVPRFSRQFLWAHASDYFTCRQSHGLRDVPAQLAELAPHVHEHLCWRFNRWYAQEGLRAHATSALLLEIAHRMRYNALGKNPERVVAYCGHDVTLLPLLHALTDTSSHGWPGYASSLRLELVEADVQRASPHRAVQRCMLHSQAAPLFVRAFFNDRPLKIKGCASNVCTLHHFAKLAQHELCSGSGALAGQERAVAEGHRAPAEF